MKILQIIYSLSSGGAERFVVDLCNRLVLNPNDEVVLLTVCDSNNPRMVHYLSDLSQKVRFVNLHEAHGLSLSSMMKVYAFVKKEKPDVVHLHSNMVLGYPTFLLYRECNYVHTLHSLPYFCLSNSYCKIPNRWFYRNRVHGITISKECQQSFNNLYHDTPSVLVTNGREPQTITSKYEDVKSEIEKYTSCKDTIVFIHVARKHPVKNQDMLFSVFERLDKEGIKFHLFVLGAGYVAEQKQYANHPKIHIIGEKNNVSDYLSFAHFFVLTSKLEGLPLTLLEAMSMGVTPICTPAGGIVDVIRDGENGYVTNGFEEEEFYQKVKHALSEIGCISSDLVRKEFIENYSMKTCAEKYYQVYEL